MTKTNLVLVTGAASGLGFLVANALEAQGSIVLRTDLEIVNTGSQFQADLTHDGDVASLAQWAKDFKLWLEDGGDDVYPILINCAGVNYIEWFESADFSQFDRLMDINVKAGLKLSQELIGVRPPVLDSDKTNWFTSSGPEAGTILNIVSNASHMPMTNSAFYNASKGAFHIATLAMARELRKTHSICVFGISPNKLAGTGMSGYIEERVPGLRGWTPEEAAKYQLAALPAGEETDPSELALFIAYLLSKPQRHKYLTNTILPYGA